MSTFIPIIEALGDPNLFGLHFCGDTWRAWRSFLAALWGLTLPNDLLPLYLACTGRIVPGNRPFTEAALVVGRRGGKSRVLALVAVFLACFRDYSPYRTPGEVATVAVDRKRAGYLSILRGPA